MIIEVRQVMLNTLPFIPLVSGEKGLGCSLLIDGFQYGKHFIEYDSIAEMQTELFTHGIIKILEDLDHVSIASVIQKEGKYKLDGIIVEAGKEITYDPMYILTVYHLCKCMERKYGDLPKDIGTQLIKYKPFQEEFIKGKIMVPLGALDTNYVEDITTRIYEELAVTK